LLTILGEVGILVGVATSLNGEGVLPWVPNTELQLALRGYKGIVVGRDNLSLFLSHTLEVLKVSSHMSYLIVIEIQQLNLTQLADA